MFWGYLPPPHDYPYYWFILDPKSKEDKYSLLMHRIKMKSPAIFLWNQQNVLCVDLSMFNQSYSSGITTTKKPTGYWRYYVPFKMSAPYSCHGTRQASTPWAMSLYFKFRAIYLWLLNEYQWWDQAKIYHIIRQLSHRFMCEIMIWSGDKTKLIHKKHFHKTTITSS